jgi:hypothetical protein
MRVDDKAVRQFQAHELAGVVTSAGGGDTFFFYDPDGVTRADARFPFATVITGDHPYDDVSDLDRDQDAYRLNLGLTRETYRSRFGRPPQERDERGILDAGVDYAARDQLMPHPIYAGQHWVCVVDPSPQTFAEIRPLIVEAHEFAARKYHHQRDGGV